MRSSLLIGAGMLALAVPASAETLREALAKAYQDQPGDHRRARQPARHRRERADRARRPGCRRSARTGGFNNSLFNSGSNSRLAGSAGDRGARPEGADLHRRAVRNSVRAAETRVEAGQFGLRGTESDLFTAVVGAYMDVIRDEAIVGLNQQNVRVLDTNLRASHDRFEVGDLTRTDVAQSAGAPVAGPRAVATGRGAADLEPRELRAAGRRRAGRAAGSAGAAQSAGSVRCGGRGRAGDNPALLAARRQSDAAAYDIGVAKAGRLPQVSVVLGGNYYNYLGSLSGGIGPEAGAGRVRRQSPGSRCGCRYSRAAGSAHRSARRRRADRPAIETGDRIRAAGDRQHPRGLRGLSLVAGSDRFGRDRGEGQPAVAGGRPGREQRRHPHDPRHPERRTGIAECAGDAGDRAPRFVRGAASRCWRRWAGRKRDDLGLEGGVLYDPTINYKRVRRNINDFASDGKPDPVAADHQKRRRRRMRRSTVRSTRSSTSPLTGISPIRQERRPRSSGGPTPSAILG